MLYRKDKYGKNIEMESYTCGSCVYYQFEDTDDKNYCTQRGHYYWYDDDDRCRYWEKSPDTDSTGCFLTTACCEFLGLPDDCYELTAMRTFRDNVLLSTEAGEALVKYYYDLAPTIVHRIKSHKDREQILAWIYSEVLAIVRLLEAGNSDAAISRYVLLVYHADKKSHYTLPELG